jgi:hypothetical protein
MITFSSCFYIIKSKFEHTVYIDWMNNLISIVNNFNLVIYTDENSCKYIKTNGNPKIKVVIKPLCQFYNYKYKEYWIKNHEKNYLLNNKSSWELNMLWSEKVWFVNETYQKKYFDSEYYGWVDIGYFRNRLDDLPTNFLSNWGKNESILQKDKIFYACINNNEGYVGYLYKLINNKNALGLPSTPIPPNQNTIAGGFFIINREKIDWWVHTYDEKLGLYFINNYLVKDDQIILADCIFSNMNYFTLFRENNPRYDNWFLFQRLLNI